MLKKGYLLGKKPLALSSISLVLLGFGLFNNIPAVECQHTNNLGNMSAYSKKNPTPFRSGTLFGYRSPEPIARQFNGQLFNSQQFNGQPSVSNAPARIIRPKKAKDSLYMKFNTLTNSDSEDSNSSGPQTTNNLGRLSLERPLIDLESVEFESNPMPVQRQSHFGSFDFPSPPSEWISRDPGGGSSSPRTKRLRTKRERNARRERGIKSASSSSENNDSSHSESSWESTASVLSAGKHHSGSRLKSRGSSRYGSEILTPEPFRPPYRSQPLGLGLNKPHIHKY